MGQSPDEIAARRCRATVQHRTAFDQHVREFYFYNLAGFSELNAALNKDIANINLDFVHHCGIGTVSGVACVPAEGRSFCANGSVQFPPEPDASYLSISMLVPTTLRISEIY